MSYVRKVVLKVVLHYIYDMIREQWYAVLYSHEVPKNKSVGIVRLGEKLVFFRDKKTGTPVCLADKCPHRGASLALGVLAERGLSGSTESSTCICCPFHGIQFDAKGRCVRIPANGKDSVPAGSYAATSYPVCDAYGFIWIYWGTKRENLPELPFFENLANSPQKLYYSQSKDYWKCHYSRCIENQLDAVHIPFVHYNTIGRGGKTLINGPALTETETELLVRADNEVDCGQKPKSHTQMPSVSKNSIHIVFRFANIWQNYITEKLRVFIAFVPVDEHHTILYLRTYQGFIKLPLLRRLFCFIMQRYSLKIAHQDRRVVETQRPDATELMIKERLISGDMPIVAYRKKRAELKKQNEELAGVNLIKVK